MRSEQRLELRAPGPAADRLGDRGVGRRLEVPRQLHGEHAARRQRPEERGEQAIVVVEPMQRGIGVDEIRRSRGRPRREVRALPGDLRRGGAGLREHLLRVLHAGHARAGPAFLEQPGDVAGARAQVVDFAGIGEVDSVQQIDPRAQALTGELEVLRWVPGHERLLALSKPRIPRRPLLSSSGAAGPSTPHPPGRNPMISLKALRLAAPLLLALGFALAARPPAFAADERLEAAKKEGKVVWYTSLALTSAEKVAKLFETAYPGVKVEVNRTGSQRILQRVMQELQANIKNVDVIHTSDAGHYVLLKEKKLLMKYTPPGVESFPASFRDKDGYHYGLRATINVIAYNTKAVPAADAPRTWKDLLDPKWRGKLVTAHPGYSGVIATHVLALVHLYGWDYFKQLAQNKPMLVQSAADPATVVASGERPVAVNGGDYSFYQAMKRGNPVEIVYPNEGVPLVVSPSAITSFAPHPTAARLFTDFTFSREIQQVLADSEGLYVGHPGVTYPPDKPKLGELKLLTVEPEELEKRDEEIKTRFVEFFGA